MRARPPRCSAKASVAERPALLSFRASSRRRSGAGTLVVESGLQSAPRWFIYELSGERAREDKRAARVTKMPRGAECRLTKRR